MLGWSLHLLLIGYCIPSILYYLFRASSVTGTTFVYRSEDPYNFGVNDDSKLIAELSIKAPEIIYHEGQWYISDLADFKGIKLARLQWEPTQ